MAADLDIEHVLCTRFEVVDGKLTGALAGPHLWGVGKRRAVEQLAANWASTSLASFAYADGSEDEELLDLVGNPRPTNPTRGLERKARERGWPVHRFPGRRGPPPTSRCATSPRSAGSSPPPPPASGSDILNRSKADAVNTMISVGGDLALGIAGIHLHVLGEEHVWSHRPAVFLFNHQSSIDPVLLMALLRRDVDRGGQEGAGRQPGRAPRRRARRRGVHRPRRPRRVRRRACSPWSRRRCCSGSRWPSHPRARARAPAAWARSRRALPPGDGGWRARDPDRVPQRQRRVAARHRSSCARAPSTSSCTLRSRPTTGPTRTSTTHIAEVRGLYLDTLANWPAR